MIKLYLTSDKQSELISVSKPWVCRCHWWLARVTPDLQLLSPFHSITARWPVP